MGRHPDLHSFPTRRAPDLCDGGEVPIAWITTGVHAPTWTASELVEMGTQATSQGDPVDVAGPVHFDGVDRIPAGELWSTRRMLRGRLVEEVRRRLRDTADRKSTRLNSSHANSWHAVFCLK